MASSGGISASQRRRLLLTLLILTLSPQFAYSAARIGVNYGRLANDLPPPSQVAHLVSSLGISRVKLYDADPLVISAFSRTSIDLVVAVPNEQLPSLASNPASALRWVSLNVARHLPAARIIAIAVGNEVLSPPPLAGHSFAPTLLPALSHIHAALSHLGLASSISVSTPLSLSTLASSFPPSSAHFAPSIASNYIRPLLDFLSATGAPVMLNAYPFLAYASEPGAIPLSYALFRQPGGGSASVKDPKTGLIYTNLFDAQLDAFYTAMAAVGHGNLPIVVTETGWPSAGDPTEFGASPENAQAYVSNLVSRVASGAGTPLRPEDPVDVYIFALFNEDMKPGPKSERNYGLFYPDKRSVYEVHLAAAGAGRRRAAASAGEGSPPSAAGGHSVEGGHHHHHGRRHGRHQNATGGGWWCVANPGAGAAALQAALDYACGPGRADCAAIQPGGTCFAPDTLVGHASYAFNNYYQRSRRADGACIFNGAAQLTQHDPSYNGCKYPGSL